MGHRGFRGRRLDASGGCPHLRLRPAPRLEVERNDRPWRDSQAEGQRGSEASAGFARSRRAARSDRDRPRLLQPIDRVFEVAPHSRGCERGPDKLGAFAGPIGRRCLCKCHRPDRSLGLGYLVQPPVESRMDPRRRTQSVNKAKISRAASIDTARCPFPYLPPPSRRRPSSMHRFVASATRNRRIDGGI